MQVPPVAVAIHKIFQLLVGILFRYAALFLNPAGEPVACTGGYHARILSELPPLFLRLPAKLLPDAV